MPVSMNKPNKYMIENMSEPKIKYPETELCEIF